MDGDSLSNHGDVLQDTNYIPTDSRPKLQEGSPEGATPFPYVLCYRATVLIMSKMWDRTGCLRLLLRGHPWIPAVHWLSFVDSLSRINPIVKYGGYLPFKLGSNLSEVTDSRKLKNTEHPNS